MHGSSAPVVDDSVEAQVELEANQRLLRKHMQEVQENKSKLSMSNREGNPRQRISSTLRNSILYGILEMKDAVFTKRMLSSVPRNLCGRYRHTRNWDQFILGFLESQQSLNDLAVKEVKYHPTINGFCNKIFSSLRAWNRTRIYNTPAGLVSFLAITLQPKSSSETTMKNCAEDETDEEVIKIDITV